MRNVLIGAIVAAAATLCAAAPAAAQVNEVSFQGRLTNSSGSPITVSTTITFRLYANVGDLVANALWVDSFTVTPNSNGVYAVRLGTNTAFPGTVTWGAQYFLGVQIVGETNEMTPRYAIGSSPYAMRSWRFGNLTDAGLAALPNVTNANLGTLTAGSSSNADGLHSHAFSALTGTGSVALLNVAQTFTAANTFSGNVVLPGAGISGAGTGSGLDADLLDGLNSVVFAQRTIAQTISGAWTFSGALVLPGTGITGAGTGSGLDADLFDGAESALFARLAGPQTFTGAQTFSGTQTVSGTLNLSGIWQIGGTGVAATAAELNKLSGTNAGVNATNLNALTGGGGTALHSHALAVGATDVTISAALLNQLAGASPNVTGINLNALTGGGAVTTLHTHFGAAWTGTNAGAAGLSVTNTDTTAASTGLLGSVSATTSVRGVHGRSTGASGTGVGVYGEAASATAGAAGGFFTNTGGAGAVALEIGAGALRIGASSTSANVTGTNLSTLTGGGDVGALHNHNAAYSGAGHTHVLTGGASDVTVGVALLNQVIFGSSPNVTGANLSLLTGGAATTLHTHSATNITTGTLPDAQLSANVSLLNAVQTYSAAKTFSASATFSAAPAFTVTPGAPFTVALGAGNVTNLNADMVDGLHGTQFLRTDANSALTTPSILTINAGATLSVGGTLNVAASGVATFNNAPAFAITGAVQPFTVSSATSATVTNLSADRLDGLDSAVFGQLGATQTWAGANTYSGATNLNGTVTINANGSWSNTATTGSITFGSSTGGADTISIVSGNIFNVVTPGDWRLANIAYTGTMANLNTLTNTSNADALHGHSNLGGLTVGQFLRSDVSDTWGDAAGTGILQLGDNTGGGDTITVPALNTLSVSGTLNVTSASSWQLAGTAYNGSMANLNVLVGGGTTSLHTHHGQSWSASSTNPGLAITNTGTGDGLTVDAQQGAYAGFFQNTSTAAGTYTGVYAQSGTGPDSNTGVYGFAGQASGSTNFGVLEGVHGQANHSPSGVNSSLVYGVRGVGAATTSGAQGSVYGGYFEGQGYSTSTGFPWSPVYGVYGTASRAGASTNNSQLVGVSGQVVYNPNAGNLNGSPVTGVSGYAQTNSADATGTVYGGQFTSWVYAASATPATAYGIQASAGQLGNSTNSGSLYGGSFTAQLSQSAGVLSNAWAYGGDFNAQSFSADARGGVVGVNINAYQYGAGVIANPVQGLNISTTRDGGSACTGGIFGINSGTSFFPGAVNSTQMIGIQQSLVVGANVSGPTYGAYIVNDAGGSNANEVGLYVALGAAGTPNVQAAIVGRTTIAGASGGYFENTAGGTAAGLVVASGRVGVGTTSPAQPLHVAISNGATTAIFGPADPVCLVANSPMVGFNAYWGPAAETYFSSNSAGMITFNQQESGGFAIVTAPSGTAGTGATMTVRMRVRAIGDVQIPTSGANVFIGGTAAVNRFGHNAASNRLETGGNLHVLGTLSKAAGSFLIDHPLDPENMILRHSFVESPEMMNVYKGHARLKDGVCEVELPTYFDALNHPATREISLTCIGGWSPLYLERRVDGNKFTVRTAKDGAPDQEFSWIIYAVRNDTYAREHPIVVEERKPAPTASEKERSASEGPQPGTSQTLDDVARRARTGAPTGH